MTTWFTSDPHLQHGFVAKIRGFESARQHDDTIIRNINRLVQPDDEMWILGDLSLRKVQTIRFALERIKCRNINIVLGNHDSAHPLNRGWMRQWQQLLDVDNVAWLGTNALVRMDGFKILLQHFPATGDGESFEDRFEDWRLPVPNGGAMLHGHTHRADQIISGRMIHVGLDAHNLEPVHEGRIKEYLREIKENA